MRDEKLLKCKSNIDGEFWYDLPNDSKIYWEEAFGSLQQTCEFNFDYSNGCLIAFASIDGSHNVSEKVTVQFNPKNKYEYKPTAKKITVITD